MKNDDRETLILSNLGLVKSIAKNFRGMGLDWEDLIQEGNIGLIQAADKFDRGRKCRFSTFATPRITGAIKDAINRAQIVRIPPRVMAARKKEEEEDDNE